jgi:NAD-reducing hydrogenase large subunit
MPSEKQTITIDPVTRIEGHSRISIHLDQSGQVENAQLHVTQFRGFEKLCQGRPFYEMPALMARICGICPVSHLIASSKACDAILAVRIPETAEQLRRIMHLAQFVESHALAFFHLASPDFLLGLDSDPARRNLFGVAAHTPQLALDGVKLRKFGQEVIRILGGKRVHPAWIVPGGVSHPLEATDRDAILAMVPEAREIALRTLAWFKRQLENFREEIRVFANFPSMFLALAKEDGGLSFYRGWIRIVDTDGKTVDNFEGRDYQDHIGEAVEPFSYLKSPYYKPKGYPEGMYRVGPLARLNMARHCGTPLADQELAEFRELERRFVLSSFYYHYARLIEILFCVERIEYLLNSEGILSKHVRAFAGPNEHEGVGVAEAPRGTLIHHYKIDDHGLIQSANMIIATSHNNLAMNRGITQAAKHFIKGRVVPEGMLNRVEAVIRAFDPCLSCSTHADGHMAMKVEVYDACGDLVNQVQR